jgi:hypothetical protein
LRTSRGRHIGSSQAKTWGLLNSNLIDLMIHEELRGAVRDVMLFLTAAVG